MSETLFQKDFSSGWIPSDDSINGRQNGLLQMDNLELDKNGALTLTGGTSVKQSGYPASAHTLYSRYQNGTRNDYSALSNGSIYRDATSLAASGGDATNAAFGTAFNFTLIASGDKRLKDTGTGTPVTLGVGAPTVAPLNFSGTNESPFAEVGSLINGDIVTVTGSSSVITSNTYGSGHARPATIKYLQATTDMTSGQYVVQSFNDPGFPFNLNQLFDGLLNGDATDFDYIPFFGYTPNPFGVSLQFDILLAAGNSAGDQALDYYSFKVNDLSTLQFDANTGVFVLYMQRSDFVRFGNAGGVGWNSVNGFRITIQGTPGQVINLLGNTPNPGVSDVVNMFGGSNAQFGVYQFAQVNVNNTGSYLALSGLGPATTAIILNGQQFDVKAQTPTDAQVTEVWIFARSTGGTNDLGQSSQLNAWYRVLVIPIANVGSNQIVRQGDVETLDLDITFNINLVSIDHTSITDKIYSIIGPIEGRWFYFTTNFMYPSDINNPDLVNPSIAVRTCGSNNELFMWALPISASVCLVGTSNDVYLLTGTFATLPDGAIDIYYQPLGVKFPPITYDAVSYNGAVYYLASDGWRACAATSFGTTYSNQNSQLLVVPNTDRLYRGETCYGYAPPNLKIPPGSVRFPCTIVRNKLYCSITGTSRVEVYDFARNYWRPVKYNLGDATAITSTQDGQVLAFYPDEKLREINILSSKLIDGSTKQTVNVLTVVADNGKPRQRKDSYTFKARLQTTVGDPLSLSLFNSLNTSTGPIGNLNSLNSSTEQFLDLSQTSLIQLTRTYQVVLTGTFADLTLEDYSIDYDPRPVPLSFLRILPNNFQQPVKKRARTWPFEIDTLGLNVTFTPNVDTVNADNPTIFNTQTKQTVYHFFTTDVFGVDYGGTLYDPSGLMEVYNVGTPDFVQSLPIARRFDQIGPSEFLRWGKVIKMGLRVLPFGTSIPWTIFFSDSTELNGVFETVSGIEDTYYADFPKGIGGRILRFTLGPTNFNFHRYYIRFLTAPSGGQENTENSWIVVPGGMGAGNL